MLRKLSSRKFLLALLGVVLTMASKELGHDFPWEGVAIIAAYVGGEGAVDVIRTMREKVPGNGGPPAPPHP